MKENNYDIPQCGQYIPTLHKLFDEHLMRSNFLFPFTKNIFGSNPKQKVINVFCLQGIFYHSRTNLQA